MSDICGLLGYTPDRSSLYRALQHLKKLGYVAVQVPGSGTQPALYRRFGEW
jgi:DNA-binding PadR family transcriptional regulator